MLLCCTQNIYFYHHCATPVTYKVHTLLIINDNNNSEHTWNCLVYNGSILRPIILCIIGLRFNYWGDAGRAFCFIHLLHFLFSFKLGIEKASSQDRLYGRLAQHNVVLNTKLCMRLQACNSLSTQQMYNKYPL